MKNQVSHSHKYSFLESSMALSALFHDVGKLGLSEEVLNKHTALNEREYSLIKTHSLLGERLVNSGTQFDPKITDVFFNL